jgi:O-acetylserine/cysteine efflux transporter
MRPIDYAATLAVMMIWGLNYPLSKLGLEEMPPLLFMALRFAVVAALLCPFVRMPREKRVGVLTLAFILGGVHFGLMFSGLARMDAGTAAIVVQTQVPFAALLAALFYGDRLGWRGFCGMVVAFAGVILIFGEPRIANDPVPPLLILAAAFAWALANIQIRRIGAIDGFALSGWLAFFAVPQLLLLSFLLEDHQIAALRDAGLKGWGGMLYNAIAVAIVSYQLWYPLIRRYPVNQTMPFTLLVPIFATGLSALILGDRLGWREGLGGVTTILGVALIVLRPFPAARAT